MEVLLIAWEIINIFSVSMITVLLCLYGIVLSIQKYIIRFVFIKTQRLLAIPEAKNTHLLFYEGFIEFKNSIKKWKRKSCILIIFIFILIFINVFIILVSYLGYLDLILKENNSGAFYIIFYSIMVGIYALSLLICTCFIYFYKKVGKKYLPHLTKWINEFKYSSGDNFYLNGENEEIPEKEKLLVYFFNENKKKAYLGYNFMSYFNDEYEQQIKIFYFVIWGYHFKEINDGDIHYSDLYQSFLYNKNNKPKDDSFFDKLFKK